MLSTDPAVVERRVDGEVEVFAPVAVDPSVRAYRWSSLTSGRAVSAFWLALLPYMLVNVAGFALPPLSKRGERVAVTLIRLAGVMLTLIFTIVTGYGFIDLGGYQLLFRRLGWMTAGNAVALGAVVGALVVIGLWAILSRVARPAQPPAGDDPVGRYRLTEAGFWAAHRIDTDLRHLHLAAAMLGVAWVGRDAIATLGWTGSRLGGAISLLAAPIVVGLILVLRASGRPVGRLPEAAAILSGLIVLWNLTAFAGSRVCSGVPCPERLSLPGHPMSLAVAAYALLTLGVLMVGLSARPRRNLAAAPALLTIAAASGAGVGAAVIGLGAAVTGGIPPTWVARLAQGFLTGTLGVLATAATILFVGRDRASGPVVVRLARAGRRLRDRAEPILWSVVLVTLVLTVGYLGERFRWWTFPAPEVGAIILALLTAGLVLAWLVRQGWWRGAAVAVLLVIVAVGVIRTRVIRSVGPFPLSFDDFTATSVTLTISLPVALVIGRVVGALRNRERRRGLAVPWDVGSFFPRWHHPFAPPPYGPLAVLDLAAFIRKEAEGQAAVLVAGHSQGSVISAVGLFLDGAIPPDIALLTFGSPLGSLYRRFFPLHFTELDALGRQISGRWINLFREDDPVGGPVGEGIDRSPMEDRHGWIHGGYWHEPEYRQAVEELHRAVSSSGG
jgi:hypothetical protein